MPHVCDHGAKETRHWRQMCTLGGSCTRFCLGRLDNNAPWTQALEKSRALRYASNVDVLMASAVQTTAPAFGGSIMTDTIRKTSTRRVCHANAFNHVNQAYLIKRCVPSSPTLLPRCQQGRSGAQYLELSVDIDASGPNRLHHRCLCGRIQHLDPHLFAHPPAHPESEALSVFAVERAARSWRRRIIQPANREDHTTDQSRGTKT